MQRSVFVGSDSEVLSRLLEQDRSGRLNTMSLREWLLDRLEASDPLPLGQPQLFAHPLPVDRDIPYLLGSLSRTTKKPPEALVEAWATGESRPEGAEVHGGPTEAASTPLNETRDKVVELLDIAQTLFEETVADAARRLDGYSEGRAAEQTAVEIYDGLRRVLGLLGD